jgi:hypothetical protein
MIGLISPYNPQNIYPIYMENWQKDLVDIIESLADETERFFLGMTDMVGAFLEMTGEISEQLYTSLADEVDQQFLHDLTEPFWEMYSELEDLVIDNEMSTAFPYAVEATAEKNPACVGCRNYHGQAYGGNLLVCAIHPHGREDTNCPDWENC